MASRKPYKDLAGQRFGKLTVVEWTGRWKGTQSIWHCKCDCGGEKDVPIYSLTGGITKSCGCLVRDKHKDRIEGKRFGRLVAVRPTDQRISCSIVWECICDCGNTVHVRSRNLLAGDTQSCGCLKSESELENAKSAREAAHVDGTLPGRLESILSGKMSHTNNSSGVTGVTWQRRLGKWQARIHFKGKSIWLGTFEKLSDAIEARKRAEDRYFREYLESKKEQQDG